MIQHLMKPLYDVLEQYSKILHRVSIIKCNTKEKRLITLNKHNNLNSDPWLVNLSNIEIPKNVHDLLKLGDTFSNPFIANKKTQALEIIKDIERNIPKVPDEFKEEFRLKVTNQTKHLLSKQFKVSNLDKQIYDMYKKTSSFLKANPNIIPFSIFD